MNFKVENARNGIILSDEEGKTVFQDDGEDEVESFASFLSELNDSHGPNSSRYADERIYVIIAPGDKNDKWDSLECPLCGREEEQCK